MSRRRIYLGLLGSWVVLTLLLTSIPNLSLEVSLPHADKIAHFGFYGVMGFLCAMWRRECNRRAIGAVLAGVVFVAVVGIVDEIHQCWIPGRTMDLFDWVADAAGGGVGALFSAFLPNRLPFFLTE
jgi:VanZ family protein